MNPTLPRLLLATDYGPAAGTALNLACSIANRFGAELHLLHVLVEPLPLAVPEGIWIDPGRILPTLEGNDKIALREHTSHIHMEPGVKVLREVVVGDPSQEIQRYATQHDIDMIILGTHGHRGLSRMILGSVAERTVRMSHCPVLTVHAPECAAGEDPLPSFRKILVATDFSPAANRARDLGWSLADKFGAELHVMHAVVEPLPLPGPNGTWIRAADVLPAFVANASRALADNAMNLVSKNGIRVVTAVKIGFPLEMIQKYVADEQIDLVLLGTQGHRGLSHLLLGSIAEKLVRLATCPVVTTH